MYSWGFFFEDGNKATLDFDFGPEHPDNLITDLDSPWMKRAYEIYPLLEGKLRELPFAFVVVNPPD